MTKPVFQKNISSHIQDRSHVNLTLNIYNCGNQDVPNDMRLKPDHYIMYFVREGSGTALEKDVLHKLSAGQLLVVFPNTEICIKSAFHDTLNISWIAFSGYLVEHHLNRAQVSLYEPVFSVPDSEPLREMFDEMIAVSAVMPNRYCKIMAKLYSIFAFMLEYEHGEKLSRSDTPQLIVLKALDFIDSNYQDDISIEQIAQSIGENRKKLYAVFKQQTSFSPRDYLTYYRMSRASELLKSTRMSIEKTAGMVGYRDQFHFSNEFKKNVGYSPTEYRKVIAEDPSKEYRAPIHEVLKKFARRYDEDLPT